VRFDEAIAVLLADDSEFESGRMRNEDQLGSAEIRFADRKE